METFTVHIDEDLEDLIPGFIEHRHEDIEVLRKAIAAGDFETARIKGHSMKGAGGGYGFDGITDIGAAIEEAAIVADTDKLGKELGLLVDYLAAVQIVFD